MTKLEVWLEKANERILRAKILCDEIEPLPQAIAIIEKLKEALESLAHQNGNEFAMQSEAEEALAIDPEEL